MQSQIKKDSLAQEMPGEKKGMTDRERGEREKERERESWKEEKEKKTER